jgi:hypothetical protein
MGYPVVQLSQKKKLHHIKRFKSSYRGLKRFLLAWKILTFIILRRSGEIFQDATSLVVKYLTRSTENTGIHNPLPILNIVTVCRLEKDLF